MTGDTSSPPNAAGLLGFAVQRPVTVFVTAVLLVLFGALTLTDLPIQLTPDISRPTLTVRTRWPGASPEEVETEVLEPQEEVLKDIQGLVRMDSQASPDVASVTLEFQVGTEVDEALVRVTNRLTQVSDYPDAADEPIVETADESGPPLAVIAVRASHGRTVFDEPKDCTKPSAGAECDPQDARVKKYRTWLSQRVVPQLDRLRGVGSVDMIGGRDTVFLIRFDPIEAASRGLSIATLAAAIRAELRDISGGDVTFGRKQLLVRTKAVRAQPAELERIVVGTGDDGTVIHLGDVAKVTRGARKSTGFALSDDRPSIVLLLRREAGVNVLEVTRTIRAEVERLNQDLFQPRGLEFEVLSDQVDYIEGALDLVRQNLLMGAVLAMCVLLFFLRDLWSSVLVALAIPICVFGTILGMSAFGRSINVVSLAGITFAVGMVLDNSIVSLESIDTFRLKGLGPAKAAYLGVKEVWGALFASTATTAAVFIPVIAWEGEVGQLLRDVAVAISFAILTSLAVSVWVIPGLSGQLKKKALHTENNSNAPTPDPRLAVIRSTISGAVRKIIDTRLTSGVTVAVAVAVCIGITFAIAPPIEYLPSGNRNLVFGVLIPPPGTSIEEMERQGKRIQQDVFRHTGKSVDGAPVIHRSFYVGSASRVFAGAVAEKPDEVRAVLSWLRKVQSKIPGFISFTNQASLFGRRGGGRSIELDLKGADLQELTTVGKKVFAKIKSAMPDAQVRPIPTLDPGAPEVSVEPLRAEAAMQGINAATAGLMVDAMVDGTTVGELSLPGQPQLDVLLASNESSRFTSTDKLLALPVTVGDRAVPLGSVVHMTEVLGPTVIRRIERSRALTLSIAPAEQMPLESALEELERNVLRPLKKVGTIPADMDVTYSGVTGDLAVAKDRFASVLIIALIISYLLMGALFEDLLAPLVVMVAVPLAAAGGMIGLRLMDATLGPQPLDLMTAVGFLILIGVVVNNAILVVDGAIARLREGLDLVPAVQAAVEQRIRPILMTTTTSLAGLLPMVLVPGSGSELYRGVGSIVLGGLLLATALTLFVVPALFTLIWATFRRHRYASKA